MTNRKQKQVVVTVNADGEMFLNGRSFHRPPGAFALDQLIEGLSKDRTFVVPKGLGKRGIDRLRAFDRFLGLDK